MAPWGTLPQNEPSVTHLATSSTYLPRLGNLIAALMKGTLRSVRCETFLGILRCRSPLRDPVHPHAPEGSVVKVPPIQPTPNRQAEAAQHLETWHQHMCRLRVDMSG